MAEDYGGWEKLEKIGEGGEGEVYRARRLASPKGASSPSQIKARLWDVVRHSGASFAVEEQTQLQEELFRAVQDAAGLPQRYEQGALKVIRLTGGGREVAAAHKRMDREIEAMQRFSSHPRCLRILHIPAEPRTWFVSEYHERGPLSKSENRLLYQGKAIKALEDVREIVDLLAQIHRESAVHRDVATKNVFVASDGRLILGDWGIVWFQDRERTRLSVTGDAIGSKDWMPVWVRGKKMEEIPPAFDVYCCGKLLWTMVAGAPEPVPREYWNRDEFNLEKMFPDSPGITFLGELFERTIVEKEDQCLKDAGQLLNFIDVILSRIKYVPDSLQAAGRRYCLVCGKGTYEWLTSAKEDEDSIGKDRAPLTLMGLSPSRVSVNHMARCTYCGHLQVFGWERGKRPPAW